MAELESLIDEARSWRRFHHDAYRHIEAAAAAIREKALLDARKALTGSDDAKYRFRSVM